MLRLFAIYNFDIVLDKNVRQNQLKSDSGSVKRGGNREIITGINEIISHNWNQLAFLARSGEDVLNNYTFNMAQGYHNIASNNVIENSCLSQNDINKGDKLYDTKVEIIRNFLDKERFSLYPL